MTPGSRGTHLFRAVAGLGVAALCGWGLWVRPRRQPRVLNAETLAAEREALFQERTALLIHAGRLQEALPLVARTLEAYPGNPVYLKQAADLQGRLGHLREEADLLERFLKVAPTPGDAFPALGDVYRELGRMDLCLHAFQRAVALEPANPEFLYYLGRAYEYGHQYAKARQTYQVACALRPGDPDALAGWGRMEVFIGTPAQALRLSGQILGPNPDNVDGLLVQGMAYRQTGQYDLAEASLAKGLRISPRYTDFMVALAGVASSRGRRDEARVWYDRYLAVHPDDTAARARRARLGHGGR